MARAEEAQQRVGDVRIEDLDRPVLPLVEERRQPADEVELGVRLEEGDGRRRRAGGGLEGDDLDLSPLVRPVEREQEGHDQGDRAEPAERGDRDDDPGGPADRDDVAEPEREHRRRREVHRAAEVGRHRAELVTEREQDQAVADDERDEPGEPGARSWPRARTARAGGRTTGRAGRRGRFEARATNREPGSGRSGTSRASGGERRPSRTGPSRPASAGRRPGRRRSLPCRPIIPRCGRPRDARRPGLHRTARSTAPSRRPGRW